MATITLHAGTRFTVGAPTITHEDGRDILVQTDRDWPGVASTFGWFIGSADDEAHPPTIGCEHAGTDGTIACHDCGMTAEDFIAAARDFIEEHDGATADDPGYFEDAGE